MRNAFLGALCAGLALLLPVLVLAVPPEPALSASTFLISEIMYNPAAEVASPDGQWFEIYNPLDEAQSLAGAVVEIVATDGNGGSGYQFSQIGAPVVEPHGFFVLGANKALALNGGIPIDYAYGAGMTLPKSGAAVRILAGGQLIDEVFFGPGSGMVVPQGVSLNLEPEGMDPETNDDAGHWCESVVKVDDSPSQTLGTPGLVGHPCDTDGDGYDESSGDCDDAEPKISPDAQEKCNGLDDNCNGKTDEAPLAGSPGWPQEGICLEAGPVCAGEMGWDLSYPEGYEEDEFTCDYLDNDCDGETDEGLRNECGGCGEDEPDLCDGIDNDCDGKTDEDAMGAPEGFECPGDRVGVCKGTVIVCAGQEKWNCVYPVGYEQEETLCDGIDNDCDGEIDEGFPIGDECPVGQGECRTGGILVCSTDKKEVICEGAEDIAFTELCGDLKDNDCDGETDEGFSVGESCSAGIGACRVTGKYFCSADQLSAVCSATSLPSSDEVCGNFLDDDCDGDIDEADCVEGSVGPGCTTKPARPCALTILLLLSIAFLALIFGRRLRTTL